MRPSSSSRHPAAVSLPQLCESATLPSARRYEHEATLLEVLGDGKGLVRLLDRALETDATAPAIADGIRAALATDVLSDRRPIPVAERQRIDELATRAGSCAELGVRDKALAFAARSRVKLVLGEADNALADATYAEHLLGDLPHLDAARVLVHSRRGYAFAMLARTEEALACYARAAHHAGACDDPRAQIGAMQDQANMLSQLGRANEAHALVLSALDLARSAGDAAGEMRAHAAIAYRHLERLEFEPARDAYAAAAAIGETGASPRLRALVSGYSALLHLEHERLERALALSARAVAECAKLNFRGAEGFFAAVQAAAHARAGDFVAADDRIRFAFARVPEGHAYVMVVRLFEAVVSVENGEADAARALLDEVSLPGANEERALVDRLDDARTAARILRRSLDGQRKSAPAQEPETLALLRRLDARRLVALLRARKGRVVSPREIAAHVWPGEGPHDDQATRRRVDDLLASEEGRALAADIRSRDEGYEHRAAPAE